MGLPLLLLSLLVRDSEFDYILIKRAIIKEQLFFKFIIDDGAMNVVTEQWVGTQDIVKCLTGISRYYDQWEPPITIQLCLIASKSKS